MPQPPAIKMKTGNIKVFRSELAKSTGLTFLVLVMWISAVIEGFWRQAELDGVRSTNDLLLMISNEEETAAQTAEAKKATIGFEMNGSTG